MISQEKEKSSLFLKLPSRRYIYHGGGEVCSSIATVAGIFIMGVKSVLV